jgi:signal transduction histidine kinase
MQWQYHLVYMQSYFIPILIAALQFGIKGGLGAAFAVSILYLPHIMLHWGGFIETNLMRFLQIVLYNVIGYLTGLKAQKEKEEKARYKLAADELKNSLQMVQKQSENLTELEEQLRQADRLAVVGELTASMAHEVRNPLGAIRGAVEIIRDEVDQENRKSEFFKILIDETNRLSSVLENYLSFARKRKPVDVEYIFQETMQNVVIMLNAPARKKRIEFVQNTLAEPVVLKGDPNELWQVLINIILNCIQAMPDGGIINIDQNILSVNSDQLPESIANSEIPMYLYIKIADDGPGIAQDKLAEIFKPFYTTKTSGSGLGLSIVKRIVDNNHWYINVISELKHGTEFVLIIPII